MLAGNRLQREDNNLSARRVAHASIVLGVLFIAGLALAYNFYAVIPALTYLTFHTILEMISVVVSFTVFLVAWYNYRQTGDGRDLLIGLTFMVVGVQDLAHTLSYNMMPAFFNANSVNKASTYWIAARSLESLGLLGALMTPRGKRFPRAARLSLLVGAVILAAAVLLVILLFLDYLPPMYIPGKGQTGIKLAMEYGVMALKAASLIFLIRPRDLSPAGRHQADHYLAYALALGIFSEMAFTLYSSAYDTYNLLGHIYKVLAFVLILRALFVTTLEHLYETNRKLTETNRLKNEFLANTNHELRTPLTAVMAFTELLESDPDSTLSERQKDYLTEIKTGSSKLLQEINSLLDLAKIEAGKMEVIPEKTDLRTFSLELKSQLESLFVQKNVTLRWPEGTYPEVYTDPGKMRQVVTNLLGNALKFTPPGGTVVVCMELDSEKAILKIKIRDTGIGIAPEEQDRIFEKFYQVDGSVTRKYKGTGIGLTLCRELVHLMGGHIGVASAPGTGAEFLVAVPVGMSAPVGRD